MASRSTIRVATREDIPEILAMIRELADYEKALSSVLATEALLSETLTWAPSPADNKPEYAAHAASPPKPFASTLLLIAPEGGVAGMALYYHTYSTWNARPGIYLEDLFVRPQFRRRGYATLLLAELAKEVQRINGGRLEWSALKWNEPALKFYRGIGAEEMDEWIGLRVDGDTLPKLAKMDGTSEGQA